MRFLLKTTYNQKNHIFSLLINAGLKQHAGEKVVVEKAPIKDNPLFCGFN